MTQLGSLFAVLSILASVTGRNSPLSFLERTGAPDPQVTLTQTGVILEWQASHPSIRIGAEGTAIVEMPGYAQSAWPGAPVLPFSQAWIALPPGSLPSMDILAVVEREVALPAPLSLAPIPEGVLRDQAGGPTGGAFVPAGNLAPFPTEAVVLEEAGVVRGQLLASLRFYPVRPAGEGLRLTEQVRVEVRFNAPSRPAGQEMLSGDPLLAALPQQVVNPEHLQPASPEPISDAPALEEGAAQGPRAAEGAAKGAAIHVSQVGLTAAAYETLQASGFPVSSVDPNNLHLGRAGQEIAYQWEGNANGQFEPGERLLFFAEPRFSRWSAQDVYFLWEGSAPGTRMSSRAADPGGLPAGIPWTEALFEKNIHYTPDCYCAPIPAGRDGDRWTWESLLVPSRRSASYPFTLPAVAPSAGGALTVWMIGFTSLAAQPDHRVEIRLNGELLGVQDWDGKQAFEGTFEIDAGVLKTGENVLTLTLPMERVEGMWLDAFQVRFARGSAASGRKLLFQGEADRRAYTIGLELAAQARAYDVTSPARPIRLTGLDVQGNTLTIGDPDGSLHRYWLGSRIEEPDRVRLAVPLRTRNTAGADYVAIAPADFIPALAPLVQLRQEQGLQIAVEEIQAIYDNFGDGRADPAAIRAFLAHAYRAWNPRPAFVLLVGDGTSDPKLYNPTSSRTFLPPFLADVDPWAGETASDNRYATLDGSDILPDVLIGRLPANSAAQLTAMVAKIVTYEAQAGLQPWSHQGLFVADNPDQAGNFPQVTEQVVRAVPTLPLFSRRLYFDPQQDSQQEFHDRLDGHWNDGAGLVMYTGHASILQWAVERFLDIEDVAALNNGTRLPVLLAMTCFTGSFQVPGFQTLDESLLRQPGGGAAAAWGSTGLGVLTGHRWLAEGFLGKLYGSPQATLGEAALAGKLNLARGGPFYDDLVETFTLLGDPAMQIVRSDYKYLPVTLQNRN